MIIILFIKGGRDIEIVAAWMFQIQITIYLNNNY